MWNSHSSAAVCQVSSDSTGQPVAAIYIAGCEMNALPCQLIAQIAGDRLTAAPQSAGGCVPGVGQLWWLLLLWGVAVAV